MSKADEMFKEIDYIFEKETETHIVYKYIGKKLHYYPIDIQFKKDTKTVIKKINILDDRTGFNMQELQAINEKCKELGWFGKKCAYCGEIIQRGSHFKFCTDECFKAYRKEYNQKLRENNIEHYKEYQRNYKRKKE